MTVSLVIPTRGRRAALEASVPYVLAMRDVEQIIYVLDGPDEDSEKLLAEISDDRIDVVVNPRRLGVQDARRNGCRAARTQWVFFLDDDDAAPPDHLPKLLQVARQTGASVVGTPRIYPADPEKAAIEAEFLRSTNATNSVGFDITADVFPHTTTRTPFLIAAALIDRALATSLLENRRHYPGNAWREETDLFLRAEEQGAICVLTPNSYTFELGTFGGGQGKAGSRLRYESWLQYNSFLFIARNRRTLKQRHGVGLPELLLAHVRMSTNRLTTVLRGRFGTDPRP